MVITSFAIHFSGAKKTKTFIAFIKAISINYLIMYFFPRKLFFFTFRFSLTVKNEVDWMVSNIFYFLALFLFFPLPFIWIFLLFPVHFVFLLIYILMCLCTSVWMHAYVFFFFCSLYVSITGSFHSLPSPITFLVLNHTAGLLLRRWL